MYELTILNIHILNIKIEFKVVSNCFSTYLLIYSMLSMIYVYVKIYILSTLYLKLKILNK